MNYLGHLLVTYPHRELTLGNLLGDMVRRKEILSLNPALQRGFEIHHAIDHFTDSHDGVKSLIMLLRPAHGKYAPVVVDILFDHVLAKEWEHHTDLSYRAFTQWVYRMIPRQADDLDSLDPTVRKRIESMVLHQWLDGYDTTDKMYHVLARMDRRAQFPSNFISGLRDVQVHYTRFAYTFNRFYADLKAHIKPLIEETV